MTAVHTLSLFGPNRADLTVIGEEGSIVQVGETFQLVSAPRRKGRGGEGRANGSTEEDVEIDVTARRRQRGAADPAVLALYADFVQCVAAGKKPDADAARAVTASRTCWLAERAAALRTEVKWGEAIE